MYGTNNVQSFAAKIELALRQSKLSPPIVVGGVGGSGTRLVVKMLETLGVSMGTQKNATEDSTAFIPVYENHINTYLTGVLEEASLVFDLSEALNALFEDSLHAGPWGWKNPRSIYLLPLLDQLFSGMHFVHVVRDGVAMSTSSNQNQLQKHGPFVVPKACQSLPQKDQSLIHWSIVNNSAADYGLTMDKRYVLVRYEDICRDVNAATKNLASALSISGRKRGTVEITETRSRDLHPSGQAETPAPILTSAALQRFGYPC